MQARDIPLLGDTVSYPVTRDASAVFVKSRLPLPKQGPLCVTQPCVTLLLRDLTHTHTGTGGDWGHPQPALPSWSPLWPPQRHPQHVPGVWTPWDHPGAHSWREAAPPGRREPHQPQPQHSYRGKLPRLNTSPGGSTLGLHPRAVASASSSSLGPTPQGLGQPPRPAHPAGTSTVGLAARTGASESSRGHRVLPGTAHPPQGQNPRTGASTRGQRTLPGPPCPPAASASSRSQQPRAESNASRVRAPQGQHPAPGPAPSTGVVPRQPPPVAARVPPLPGPVLRAGPYAHPPPGPLPAAVPVSAPAWPRRRAHPGPAAAPRAAPRPPRRAGPGRAVPRCAGRGAGPGSLGDVVLSLPPPDGACGTCRRRTGPRRDHPAQRHPRYPSPYPPWHASIAGSYPGIHRGSSASLVSTPLPTLGHRRPPVPTPAYGHSPAPTEVPTLVTPAVSTPAHRHPPLSHPSAHPGAPASPVPTLALTPALRHPRCPTSRPPRYPPGTGTHRPHPNTPIPVENPWEELG